MDASEDHEQDQDQEAVPEHEHEAEQGNDQDQAQAAPEDAPLPESDEHHDHEQDHQDERPTRPCGHEHVVHAEEEEGEEGDPEAVEHEHATELCVYHDHDHDDIPPHEHKEHAGDQQEDLNRPPDQQAQHDEEAQAHATIAEGTIEVEHEEHQHNNEPLMEAAPVIASEAQLQASVSAEMSTADALPAQVTAIAKQDHAFQRMSRSSAHGSRRRTSERYHASAEQLRLLIQAFQQDPTPSAATLKYLSTTIGMPMHNMVLWFKNRRARHKKHHPSQAVAKTGRRSYVKSGIYARASKKVKIMRHSEGGNQAIANPTMVPEGPHTEIRGGTTHEVAGIARSAGGSQGETDMHQVALLAAAVEAATPVSEVVRNGSDSFVGSRGKDEGMVVNGTDKRRFEEDGRVDELPPAKRTRYQGVVEIVGDENPCRVWDAQECHRRCCSFFVKNTSGCEQPEQTKSAHMASEMFFLGELQSGLTLTSAMQSLDISAGVLDKIMDQIGEGGQGVKLNSGSRAVLREFIAQVRSGQAIHVHIEGRIEDTAKEGSERISAEANAETEDQVEKHIDGQMEDVQAHEEDVQAQGEAEEKAEEQAEEQAEDQRDDRGEDQAQDHTEVERDDQGEDQAQEDAEVERDDQGEDGLEKPNELQDAVDQDDSNEHNAGNTSEQHSEPAVEHSHTEAAEQPNDEPNEHANELAVMNDIVGETQNEGNADEDETAEEQMQERDAGVENE